ncbi:small multidrug resistance protein, partial [Bacillus mycoides]
ALDMADNQINWSVTIAIPIFLMCVTLIWLNRMFYKKNKKRWLAFVGVITISVFILTAWISFILGHYSNRPYTFSRSLEDMKVFLSIGTVCLVLSYSFPNKWKEILKRKFHF